MSINMLEKFVSGAEMRTRMPAVSCIGSMTDDEAGIIHNWENAVDVDPTEMSCQVILVFVCLEFISVFVACFLHYNCSIVILFPLFWIVVS